MMSNRINSEEELIPLFNEDRRPEQETKLWDRFEDIPVKAETGSMEESKWIDFSVKVFKLLAYVVTFAVVLGSAVISKGTLFFMTSQITIDHTKPYCNRDLDINQQFVVKLPRVERVAWIWMLMFTFFVPELGTFIRSVRMCLFKTWKMPKPWESIALFITESLSTIGSALLVFCILPDLDVVKGAMLTNAVCFVPAVVGFFSRDPADSTNVVKMVLDVTSIVAQATAFVVWPMIENRPVIWLIPISIVFISCGWWENYVSEDSPITFIKKIAKDKKNFENSRYFIYTFLSLWKCLLFFITVLVIVWVNEGRIDFLFDEFSAAFAKHDIIITEIKPIIGDQSFFDIREVIETGRARSISSDYLAPVWVFLINITTTYLCYIFGKFACKILIQGFSYAFPINLTVPVSISLLIAVCGVYNGNECSFYEHIPPYLFFNSPPVYFLRDFIASEHSWIWLLWLLSQTWITIHIWTPHCERLARTEKLYVRPMYDAFVIDQSVAMNRRRDDRAEKLEIVEENSDGNGDNQTYATINREQITTIYACGTMWHETKEEMMEFLKSVMRLDEDQFARRLVREELELEKFMKTDYYNIETHIFFDDAFIRKSEHDNDPRVNEHVKNLVMAMDEAAKDVHEAHIRIRPPIKYNTPYGGRLVWTLPGKTKLYAHLKDKKKIRPKKRWSQVMYMYYLLGYRLMEREGLSPEQKDIEAENTYLLALDGDIDFQPDAVHLLVDLMKKNKTVGAACGRIHPLGSGPMVWYQMFEYAIGHWLQKATEHMIGCVLCSPGCFSLFRAKALMDDNVMRKYTTRSEEARQFVQYDQGEDRWLCTLLLQRGYRVEYSAASDAFTHCPEGFNEFYNQRRRWIPSTTANILDLLMNYKRTIKINDNVSRLYILYQIVLMVGTILGPGTIFLMLVGAFVAAFQMDQWSSFLWNAVPILVFMVICFLFKSDVQLFFAGVISAIYGLVMMAVLVGVMLQISSDGLLAPSSLFFFCVAGEMILTGLLHPKEIGCLPYGIVYYVTVPSMYMLLIIYCVFNLNNISWGTREVTVAPQINPDEINEQSMKETKEVKKAEKTNKIMAFFGNGKTEDNTGTLEFSIAGLLKCMFCTHRKNDEENIQLLRISDDLKNLSEKLGVIERAVRCQPDNEEKVVLQQKIGTTHLEGSKGTNVSQSKETEYGSFASDRKSQIYDTLEPNNWLEEEDLGHGEYDCISTDEKLFWEGLLDKYLHPIEDNKEKVAKDLKDLRDKSVMAFFMVNALFVLVVFLLTLKKDLLHVNWPFDVQVNFTYLDDVSEIVIYKQYLELEPIGFVFLIFFASLLVVQFIAMLFHRFGTFAQILATTKINWGFCTKLDKKDLTEDQILENDPLKAVKQLIKIRGVEDDDDEKEIEEPAVGRRKTVQRLAEPGPKKQTVNDLFEAFERRTRPNKYEKSNKGGRKSMAVAVNKRRNTVHNLRRDSHVQRSLPSAKKFHINKAFDDSEF